jgi:hypothetical protein
MDIWSWLWIAWAAAFAVIEGLALALTHGPGTLSDKIRLWITRPGNGAWYFRAGRVLMLVFLAWLAVHFDLGWLG